MACDNVAGQGCHKMSPANLVDIAVFTKNTTLSCPNMGETGFGRYTPQDSRGCFS
jgi:hypothetical protein